MFLKKIKNNFLVCDQHKIMQRIVCFFVIFKNARVSSNVKYSLWICWFLSPSSLPDFLEYPIIYFSCILVAHCSAPCSLVLLSTAAKVSSVGFRYWIEWFFSHLHPLSFSISATFYTIEQHFLNSVSSLEDIVICHRCEYSHINLKIYLKNCALRFCLQNASESHP